MSEFTGSIRYAQALFELADKDNALYPVYVALQEIGTLLKEKDEFKIFIHNPLLSQEEKEGIIRKVFAKNIPKILFTFLLFLNSKDRLGILAEVVECFDELYLIKNNQMRASLETAFALKNDQMENIQQKLGQKYKKEITLKNKVKDDLLGGFRLLAAGMLFDSSIKSQLESFRQKVLI